MTKDNCSFPFCRNCVNKDHETWERIWDKLRRSKLWAWDLLCKFLFIMRKIFVREQILLFCFYHFYCYTLFFYKNGDFCARGSIFLIFSRKGAANILSIFLLTFLFLYLISVSIVWEQIIGGTSAKKNRWGNVYLENLIF